MRPFAATNARQNSLQARSSVLDVEVDELEVDLRSGQDDQRLFQLKYTRGRIGELALASGEIYKFRYDYDSTDNYAVTRSYLTGPNRAVTKFDIRPE
jgi:hypothetical protein